MLRKFWNIIYKSCKIKNWDNIIIINLYQKNLNTWKYFSCEKKLTMQINWSGSIQYRNRRFNLKDFKMKKRALASDIQFSRKKKNMGWYQ